MKPFSIHAILAALALSVVLTLPFMPFARDTAPRYRLEMEVLNTQFGVAQVYYDLGTGLSEKDSVRIEVEPGAWRTIHFALPSGAYRSLRFDPTDRPGEVSLRAIVLRTPGGREIRRFSPNEIQPGNQIDRTEINEGTLRIISHPGSFDPTTELRLAGGLILPSTRTPFWQAFASLTLPLWIVLAGLLSWLSNRALPSVPAAAHALTAQPLRLLALVALGAVVLSTYPVVFFGKSFASPNYGAALLYDAVPTLPGLKDRRTEDVKGSDVGPLFWQNMTHAMIQRDALLAGEWPFWFRYNSAGTELIGQGQSMFGDPLHFLTILFSGSAWAWDAKFLIAKWLFTFGLGWLAYRVSGSLLGAALVAGSSAFIGFFSFRINHPAFFSFTYAPWILIGWLKLHDGINRRRQLIACGWLLGANWAVLNSGTAKEAYMLLVSLNATGALIVVSAQGSLRGRFVQLGLATLSGIVLILISAPIWLTFLDALRASYTSYNAPSAWQIHPSFLIGLFDEIFYRPLQPAERVSNPSTNFLILGGLLYLCATWRARPPGRIAAVLAIACIPAAAMAFGVIPPQWIQSVPFLGNVAHIDNCFSLVLIILLSVLAACGFESARQRLGTRPASGDLAVAGILLVALLVPWISAVHTVHKPLYPDGERFTLHAFGERMAVSPFVWASLIVLPCALVVGAWTLHRLRARRRPVWPAAALVLSALLLLLVRHGQHLGTAFGDYVVNPPTRPDLLARSPGIDAIRGAMKSPARAVGIEGNLFPGWGAAYRLEGISGPEALMNPYFRELADAFGIDRVWDWRLMVHTDTLPRLRKAYDLLNIEFFADYRSDQERVGALLTPVRMADLDIYRSDSVWPRAFFTDRLAVYTSVDEFARAVAAGDGRPFAAIQSSSADRPSFVRSDLTGRTVVPAQDYQLTPNATRFVIDAPTAGVAVLTEAWQDGNFEVTVNGRPTRYFRLNHAFKGIAIQTAGRQVIEFRYTPRRAPLAFSLAMAGLAIVGAAVWWARRPGQTTA